MLTILPACVAADTNIFRVRRVSKATGLINTIAEFVRAYDVLAGPEGNVYFADFAGTLYTYNIATATVTSRPLTSLADGSTQFLDAQLVGLALNPVNGLLYAAYESDPADTTSAFGGAIFSVNLSSPDPAVLATRFPAGDLNSAQYITLTVQGRRSSAQPATESTSGVAQDRQHPGIRAPARLSRERQPPASSLVLHGASLSTLPATCWSARKTDAACGWWMPARAR